MRGTDVWSHRARAAGGAWGLALVGSAIVLGCAQIIGADTDRELAPVTHTDASPEEPEPGPDPSRCPDGEKRCDGACVPKSVEYGCGSESCTPCSLPHVETMACQNDECVAATCKPGFGACGDAREGCLVDLSSPATCTDCAVACDLDAGEVCAPSGCGSDCGQLTNCAGACVDLDTNPNHCGACGNACPGATNGDAACENGQCIVKCRERFGRCDGSATGPCTEVPLFYRDRDADGYGVTSETTRACNEQSAGAGWGRKAGDCHDGNANVHPGQTQYFGTPYPTPQGAESFDYDCNGKEEAMPGSRFDGCKSGCNEGAGGYSSPASPSRPGADNEWCGSTTYTTCGPASAARPSAGNLQSIRPLASSTCETRTYTDWTANPCR